MKKEFIDKIDNIFACLRGGHYETITYGVQ